MRLSWEAALAALPLGFMMFSMITINEIPDESQDREGGKRTLVVLLLLYLPVAAKVFFRPKCPAASAES